MPFVTAQTNAVELNGSQPPLLLITGTYSSSGGDTGGGIAAGYTNASGTYTAVSVSGGADSGAGGRKIISYSLTPNLSETAPGGVLSYNTTIDRDVLTIVTVADTAGTYQLLCMDNGQ